MSKVRNTMYNACWVWLSVQLLVLTIHAMPVDETKQFSPDSKEDLPWWKSGYLIIASASVAITAIIALACCTCGACNSKGAMNNQLYQKHTRQIRQIITEANAPCKKPDLDKLAKSLYDLGVTEREATAGLLTIGQMDKYGVTEYDLSRIGGKEELFKKLRLLEIRDLPGQTVSKTMSCKPQAVIRPSNTGLPMSQQPSLTSSIASSKMGVTGPQRNIITPSVPQTRTGGLDESADMDEYTIYDEGVLNDYGILKMEKEKKFEGAAGLDKDADFDDYTIYDEGALNEYGLVKDMLKKKVEGGAGLDNQADFDDYTIYDEGALNDYGLVKEMREKKGTASAGLDESADFDDYTIYEQGELNEYGILKLEREKKAEGGAMTCSTTSGLKTPNLNAALTQQMKKMHDNEEDLTVYEKAPLKPAIKMGASGRPKTKVKAKVRTRTHKEKRSPCQPLDKKAEFDDFTIYDIGGPHMDDGGFSAGVDFENYTIYDQGGPSNAQDGAVGLNVRSDFDEYTIYDQGGPNNAQDGAVGLNVKSDFDDYTIYNQGGPPPRANADEGVGLDQSSPFEDYTIYDNGANGPSNYECVQRQADQRYKAQAQEENIYQSML